MNLWKGRAKVVIEGKNCLAFINQIKTDCVLYRVKCISNEKIIFITDFSNLCHIFAKNSNKWYNINVESSVGVKPLLCNLKMRIALVVAFLLLCAAFAVFSQFFWKIEVCLKTDGDESLVYEKLREHGIIARAKASIDKSELERYLYRNLENATFVNCSTSGIKLKVEVAFALAYDLAKNEDIVTAKRSGVVSKIIVYHGSAIVKIGDKVSVGDTLIVGELLGEKTPASGEVFITHEIEGNVSVPRLRTEYFLTGNYVDKTSLNMLLFESSKNKGEIPYAMHRTVQFSYYPFANNLLPIKVIVTRYFELVVKVIGSDFVANKNLYLAKAKSDVLSAVIGDYAILMEEFEIENQSDYDMIKLFFLIEQRA